MRTTPLRAIVVALAASLAAVSVQASSLDYDFGVRDGPGCSPTAPMGVRNIRKFGQWLGRRPDRILEFAWTPSWDVMVDSTRILAKCWRTAGYGALTYSIGMLPDKGTATLALGAGGDYDQYFRRIADILIAEGYGNAVIRIGQEFNIPSSRWAALNDPGAFVAYWRRIASVMRSEAGAHFKFDWCLNLNYTFDKAHFIDPTLVYPGDQYVDIVGMDVYNKSWPPLRAITDGIWRKHYVNTPFGLEWQRTFAQQHGKLMSIPEWGTGKRQGGGGGGDDPAFINHMARWISDNNVSYNDYWDEHATDYDSNLSDGGQPLAAKAFRAAFGARRSK